MIFTFLSYFNGVISGSYILQLVMNKEWTNGNRDIDIYLDEMYVNKYILLPALKGKYGNKYIHNDTNNLYNDPTMVEVLRNYFRYYFGEDAEIDIPENGDTLSETKFETDTCDYNSCIYFKKLIKIVLKNKNKIDIIICSCNPKIFLKEYDFDFNKIYFDGFTIGAEDWNPIVKKTSVNGYKRNRYNVHPTVKYINNITRIKKYTDRGFLILPS